MAQNLTSQVLDNCGDGSQIVRCKERRSYVVHVEVLLEANSLLGKDRIELLCSKLLWNLPVLTEDLLIDSFEDPELTENVKSVLVCPDGKPNLDREKSCLLHYAKPVYHVYYLNTEGAEAFDFGPENSNVEAATHWTLPSTDFHGLWESLIFDSDVKSQLLNYVSSTLLFSEKQVNTSIVPWNKVVLLHGPPGTGKTSLCKALAQKICIRFEEKYAYGHLLEINSHSLFSKWFSESGKLVTKLFKAVQSVIDDPNGLVIVLIDEVESLAHSRKSAFSGSAEPSDSIRVVNALLTHLDKIKRYPNVLILTTSNITEAIDVALVDRADIKQYIGPPSAEAIYQIFYSCICELQRAEIIWSREKLLQLSELKAVSQAKNCAVNGAAENFDLSFYLMDISKRSVGLSGRTVRKLPLMAHALHIKQQVLTLKDFLVALEKTVEQQFRETENLSNMIDAFKQL